MAQYETKVLTLGDITVTVSKAKSPSAGDRIEAVLRFLVNVVTDPGYGVGSRPRPDQGLPGSGARPDQGLPGSQPKPDQGLPPSGERPDQGLPGSQPEVDQGLPGEKLASFLKDNAAAIAKAILKGTACDPAQPK